MLAWWMSTIRGETQNGQSHQTWAPLYIFGGAYCALEFGEPILSLLSGDDGSTSLDDADAGPLAVIGKVGDYIPLAKTLGARYFSIPYEDWEALKRTQRWALNEQFLDEAVADGCKFVLANPIEAAKGGSFYYTELKYLQTIKEYTSNSARNILVPPK
jgi:hypothetical protein